MFESFLRHVIFFLFAFAALHHLTKDWSGLKGLFIPLFIVATFSWGYFASEETLIYWLADGLIIALIYMGLYAVAFRYRMALIPMALAIPSLLSKIRFPITYPHPVGIQAAIVAFVLIALFAVYWVRMLDREVSKL